MKIRTKLGLAPVSLLWGQFSLSSASSPLCVLTVNAPQHKLIWRWHSVKTASKCLHPNSSGKYFIHKTTGHPGTSETLWQVKAGQTSTVCGYHYTRCILDFVTLLGHFEVPHLNTQVFQALYNLFHTSISTLSYFSCSFIVLPILFSSCLLEQLDHLQQVWIHAWNNPFLG